MGFGGVPRPSGGDRPGDRPPPPSRPVLEPDKPFVREGSPRQERFPITDTWTGSSPPKYGFDLPSATKLLAEPPQPSMAQRFLNDLRDTAVETALWNTFELTADTIAPGLGSAVKAARLVAGLADAATSVEKGRGFDVKIPLGIGNSYDAHIRIRLLEADPPPFPSMGLEIGSSSSGAAWRDVLVDGVPPDTGNPTMTVGQNVGLDMEALVQRAAERAHAVGDQGERGSAFAVAYLDPRSQTGRIVIGSGNAQPYSPLSFEIHTPTPVNSRLNLGQPRLDVVAVADDNGYTCPGCGWVTLSRRGSYEVCDECDWTDDGQDEHDADIVRGDPNGSLSLTAARARYIAQGGLRGEHMPPRMPFTTPNPGSC